MTLIAPAGDAYRGASVQLDLPVLEAGAVATVAAAAHDEAVLVLLAGDVEWAGRRVARTDVFDAPAAAVYLPPGTGVEVRAHSRAELALAATVDAGLSASADAQPTFVSAADVVVHERGEPGWQRQVYDIVDQRVPAQRLLVGETFNEPGQWSSFPPHKHDGGDGEPALEEVYAYRFDRPDGFGFQGIYESNGDERAEFLRHGRVIGFARGYHPVCAAPGYRLYYLWVLAGFPRQLALHEDPAHRWLTAGYRNRLHR